MLYVKHRHHLTMPRSTSTSTSRDFALVLRSLFKRRKIGNGTGTAGSGRYRVKDRQEKVHILFEITIFSKRGEHIRITETSTTCQKDPEHYLF